MMSLDPFDVMKDSKSQVSLEIFIPSRLYPPVSFILSY